MEQSTVEIVLLEVACFICVLSILWNLLKIRRIDVVFKYRMSVLDKNYDKYKELPTFEEMLKFKRSHAFTLKGIERDFPMSSTPEQRKS